MSLEESSDTLPGIIKSLAQQVYSRDAQLERERARYVEELSVFKEQCDTMRKERDSSLRELTQAKAHSQEIKAAYNLEKAELLKQVDLLKQAAVHQAEELTRSHREEAAWKSRWEEWSSQFSQMSRKVDELTEALRNSISSPTVADSSLSPHKPSPTDESLFAQPHHQRARISPDTIDQVATPTSVTCRRTRSVYPNNTGVASELSINESPLSRAQLREASKARVPNRPVKSSSHSALPPDRVIHTAYFEIKQERESSSSEALSVREDDNEDEIPSSKRKRSSMRTQRYIEDDEKQEEDADDALHKTGHLKRLRENKKQDDHDEIAIGVEDNHKEVYGYKRVHVREVNLGRVPQRYGGRLIRH